MIRFAFAVSAIALISACASIPVTAPIPSSDFVAAVAVREEAPRPPQIIEAPAPSPMPGQLKPVTTATSASAAPKGAKPAKVPTPKDTIDKGRKGALVEPSVDGFVNAVQIYAFTEGALYRLYASPGQVTDIALEPGEALISVSAGDTVRWIVGDTRSGSGASSRAHVLVKPVSAAIRTNLMIATDRRTYHLELESVASGYMAALSWRYPVDEFAALTAAAKKSAERDEAIIGRGLDISNLNFDYQITGDMPDWTPVRVFDDGKQVFIQMPDTIAATDLPPLFVLGETGKSELVNYRVRGNYYVVDRLFRAAELRLGAKSQTIVRISKRASSSRRNAWFGD